MALILVIDDECGILEAMEALLVEEGHRVERAINGEQALAKLAVQPIDVMLLDLMMPVMDGPALLEVLRADPALRKIPVIVMSGLPAAAIEQLELEGYAVLLSKPFRAQQLYEAVDYAITRGSS